MALDIISEMCIIFLRWSCFSRQTTCIHGYLQKTTYLGVDFYSLFSAITFFPLSMIMEEITNDFIESADNLKGVLHSDVFDKC